jgi:hypothetical protein
VTINFVSVLADRVVLALCVLLFLTGTPWPRGIWRAVFTCVAIFVLLFVRCA